MRRLILTAVAGLLVTAPSFAAERWAHLRVIEADARPTRIEMNLPVRALRAAVRLLETDSNARMEISGAPVRLSEISHAWAALRNEPAGAVVSRLHEDGTLTFRREVAGMTLSSSERWSGEETTVFLSGALADALSRGDRRLDFDAVAAALATTNGAPLRIRSSDATSIDIWVDDSPHGVTP